MESQKEPIPDSPTESEPKEQYQKDQGLDSWDGPNDPDNPLNWTNSKKWLTILVVYFQVFCLTLGSSIVSPSIQSITIAFHIRPEVGILTLSLYVFGWTFGPLVGVPLSNVFGRKAVAVTSALCFFLFQFGSAFAQNIQTLLICRFLTGFIGSPPISSFTSSIVDMWAPRERGPPVSLGILLVFFGPVVGPLVGGAIAQYSGNWRWSLRAELIITFFLVVIPTLMSPETHEFTILRRRAKLREGDAKSEGSSATFHRLSGATSKSLQVVFWIPMRLLVSEPIVILVSLYLGVLYGILYLYFAAYPVIFEGRYHFGEAASGAAFLGIGVGVLGTFFTLKPAERLYARLDRERGNGTPFSFPEGRLPYAMVAAILAPISFFWLGWSGFARIHWVVPILSGVPFGWSMVTLFTTMLAYCGEAYPNIAASAMASNGIARYLLAAVLPVLVPKMYTKLEPQWAQTILGCVAVAFVPVPFFFWKYGPRIRANSKWRNDVRLT